ncbi:hypothetical protein O6P37_10850 [Mycobacterium sp. CPCC 205372]|uniref:Low molecular weight antigen MTB12-like C-terminal domain-containing protein n=1 Tax=Mycobacterium hippophais TaxID=3016340 RepID=A0ABT4PS25_9MYCO|nr:hypothetical protein [Mycobacterium hippophais]MCZ8379364.1 hypothetical protein [Mycobacterium hippophais]
MDRHRLWRAARLPIGLTCLVGLLLGCQDRQEPAVPVQAQTTSTVAGDGPPIPVPSPGELNAGFMIGLDPSTSEAVRIAAVEGSDIDPQLPTLLKQASVENGVKITVTGTEYVGDGVVHASSDMLVRGKPVEGKVTIPFVASDGRWKLQKAWACQQLANASLQSPACTG